MPYWVLTCTEDRLANARTSAETRLRFAVVCSSAWRMSAVTKATGSSVRLVTSKTSHDPSWVCSGVTGAPTVTALTCSAVSTWDSGKLQPSCPPAAAVLASVEVDAARGRWCRPSAC